MSAFSSWGKACCNAVFCCVTHTQQHACAAIMSENETQNVVIPGVIKLDQDPQNFDRMLDIIDQDPGYLLWIKMSRLTFGPWQIEKYALFEKHLGWVTK